MSKHDNWLMSGNPAEQQVDERHPFVIWLDEKTGTSFSKGTTANQITLCIFGFIHFYHYCDKYISQTNLLIGNVGSRLDQEYYYSDDPKKYPLLKFHFYTSDGVFGKSKVLQVFRRSRTQSLTRDDDGFIDADYDTLIDIAR